MNANALHNPTQIWVIVCKDIETNQYYIFREVTTNEKNKEDFLEFSKSVDKWIGHNYLGYDYPVLNKLLGFQHSILSCYDTLVLSKLIDYPRKGHSIENYGAEFQLEKTKYSDWSKYSKEMEDYCIRDVDICHKVYLKYKNYLNKKEHKQSIELEHKVQLIVNDISNNGFSFNTTKGTTLLLKVKDTLSTLDNDILKVFPPKLTLVKEVIPKETKHGTLNKQDFKWVKDGDLSIFNGGPFCRCHWSSFNPSSHKQIVSVLRAAGWVPVDKTQTHIDTEREINRIKYTRNKDKGLDLRLEAAIVKLEQLRTTGWKINETNLSTLPPNAPPPARLLAKRILYESRRRTLTEWLNLVQSDGRIHGKFYAIGAWTHRMAHQQPNTANIPNEFDTQGEKKLLGKELRSLWQAPKKRLLVGVDAEGIQLRIFAHYIDDKEFTHALSHGRKSDKTDPHSLNQRILGSVCKSRAAAKRFIYALLLGAGSDKLASILEASKDEADSALDRLMERYQGFVELKKSIIPADSKRGWFVGLDGRAVKIPGESPSERRHLCMSGYLQNGEAVIMKLATVKWYEKLFGLDWIRLRERSPIPEDLAKGPYSPQEIKLVNFVHDEWQTETPNDMEIAIRVAEVQSSALREVGEDLKLKCPLAGSYWSDDHNDYTIGTNWSVTH